MDLISIIVPVYNGEKYINNCLNSILNQSISNFEVIIVNDGSTDSTSEILEKYDKEERIIVLNIENSGPGLARNKGIEKSNGNLICFIDVDDYVSEFMLEDLYNEYKSSNSDVVMGKVKISKIRNIKFNRQNEEIAFINGNDLIKKMLTQPSILGYTFMHGKLYNKKFINKYNIRFKELSFAEDTVFNLNVYLNTNRISQINKEVYLYYTRDESLTNKYDDKLDTKISNVIQQIDEDISNKSIKEDLENEKNNYIINLFIGYIFNEMKSKDNIYIICKNINKSNILKEYYDEIVNCICKNKKYRIIQYSLKYKFFNVIIFAYYIKLKLRYINNNIKSRR